MYQNRSPGTVLFGFVVCIGDNGILTNHSQSCWLFWAVSYLSSGPKYHEIRRKKDEKGCITSGLVTVIVSGPHLGMKMMKG